MTERVGIATEELTIALRTLTKTVKIVTEEDEQLKTDMDKYATRCKG